MRDDEIAALRARVRRLEMTPEERAQAIASGWDALYPKETPIADAVRTAYEDAARIVEGERLLDPISHDVDRAYNDAIEHAADAIRDAAEALGADKRDDEIDALHTRVAELERLLRARGEG
jgi:hypothetical protein